MSSGRFLKNLTSMESWMTLSQALSFSQENGQARTELMSSAAPPLSRQVSSTCSRWPATIRILVVIMRMKESLSRS
jgi:hypothetical protein